MRGWTEHGDGVFAKRYQSINLTIGLVVTDSGLVVVDTRAHHEQGRELAADIRSLTRKPVRWVVNTHHHWDHTFGNAVFADAAIWGHRRCAAALAERGEDMKEQVKAMAPDHAAVLDDVIIAPPTHLVDDSTTVSFGGRRLELSHVGRGHTDNDIIIRVVDEEVIFAGDLIEEGAPPAFGDAFPLEWPDTLGRLSEIVAGPVVPGHGATVGHTFVSEQREELAAIAASAVDRHAQGMTPAEAAAAGGPYPKDTLQQAFERAWEHLEVTS